MEGQSVNEIQVEQPYLKLRCRHRVLPLSLPFALLKQLLRWLLESLGPLR